MNKKKIVVFTGNRAEFSMLTPIIKSIEGHDELECHVVVSGGHLESNHSDSLHEIESEGITIGTKIFLENVQVNGSILETTKTIGEVILKFSDFLVEFKPDIVLIASDRFESFGASIAASQLNIPVAHFEGGDITQGGALDDSLRHAMTKLSHIHFTTNEEATTRVLKLGEENWRVKTVGFPGLNALLTNDYKSADSLLEELSLRLDKPLILFTQHSITIEPEKSREQVQPSLEALNFLAENYDCQVIITYPNNDAGGKNIIEELEKFKKVAHSNIQIIPHLGRKGYYGILNICGKVGKGVCIGNSSSGIKETPMFNCPSIMIGTRQEGRLRATNVEQVGYDKNEIIEAAKKALFNDEYRESCGKAINPYGQYNTGETIADFLAGIDINKDLINKKITY